jgi:formylmethanofuran dehydrogenase subunit E
MVSKNIERDFNIIKNKYCGVCGEIGIEYKLRCGDIVCFKCMYSYCGTPIYCEVCGKYVKNFKTKYNDYPYCF